jgi:hypothetical protein
MSGVTCTTSVPYSAGMSAAKIAIDILSKAQLNAGCETSKYPAGLILAIAQPIGVRVNERHQAERKPEIRRRYAGAYEVVRQHSSGFYPGALRFARRSPGTGEAIVTSFARRHLR